MPLRQPITTMEPVIYDNNMTLLKNISTSTDHDTTYGPSNAHALRDISDKYALISVPGALLSIPRLAIQLKPGLELTPY